MTSLQHHLLEIKWRLFYITFSAICIFLICYNSPVEIVYIIGKPFLKFQQTFIFLDLTEAFYTFLKISFILTVLLSFPFTFYHIWSFLIPSFYKSERNKINFFFLILLFLFTSEIGFSYFFLFPKICHFLLGFELSSGATQSDPLLSVEFSAQIGLYVTLFLKFFIGILLFCQIPVGVCFLLSKNLLDVCWFLSNRKLIAFSSLLLSSFLVPPDFLIQFLVTLFFVFLSELFIFCGLVFQYSHYKTEKHPKKLLYYNRRHAFSLF